MSTGGGSIILRAKNGAGQYGTDLPESITRAQAAHDAITSTNPPSGSPAALFAADLATQIQFANS